MEEIHRDIFLKESRIYLLQNLGDVHMIVEHLYAAGEFTEIEKDEILSKRVSAYQRSALLDLLPRKGPTAYATFIKALESEGCGFVVEALKDAEESLRQRQSKVREEERTNTWQFNEPPKPHSVDSHLTTEGDLGRLNLASGTSASPHMKQSLEPEQAHHQIDKPRLVSTRFNIWGRIAFDPEGNLLCLRKDGTATLFRASNGSVINNYDSYITNDIHCVAISPYQIAIIHVQYNVHIVELFDRNDGQINFSSGITVGNLRDPCRCCYVSNQGLIVTERSAKSIAMVNERGNFLKRIPLDYQPYDITIDKDNSFYVSDYSNPQIERFHPDGTAAGVFQCKDKSGRDFQPFGIAVDGSSCLYVCDHHGNRISRLSDGRFIEWLGEEDGIESPVVILFNTAGQLAIYSWATGKIILYDMN